jgi:hypothetical protein
MKPLRKLFRFLGIGAISFLVTNKASAAVESHGIDRRVEKVRNALRSQLKNDNPGKNLNIDFTDYTYKNDWVNWGNWGNWNNWNNWVKWDDWNNWAKWNDFSNWQKFSNY